MTKSNPNEIFGKNVRFYRERLGLTQLELAHLVGYQTKGAISLIEQGQRDVPTPLVISFAKALKVPVSNLIDDYNENMSFQPFFEYLPYLANAEEWKIKAIRELLNMPNKKELSLDTTKIIG